MTPETKLEIIEDFTNFCKIKFKIQELPSITLIDDKSWVLKHHSFGQYSPQSDSLLVYSKDRNLADVLRTLAHELFHHKQNELNMLDSESGKTGSEIENQANAAAGIALREYGKKNKLIYESIKSKIIKKLLLENGKK